MKIILLIYIFAYTFCLNEINNITYCERLEINDFLSGNRITIKPLLCDDGKEFYLRLKIEDLSKVFIQFNLEKSNNIIFKEVKAFEFTSYPSNEKIVNDASNPLVNVLNAEFSQDANYEYIIHILF